MLDLNSDIRTTAGAYALCGRTILTPYRSISYYYCVIVWRFVVINLYYFKTVNGICNGDEPKGQRNVFSMD